MGIAILYRIAGNLQGQKEGQVFVNLDILLVIELDKLTIFGKYVKC